MNNSVKCILIFAGGFIAGGISTYLGMRQRFKDKLERETNEVREVYNEKISHYEKPKTSLEGDIKGPETIEEKVHLDRTTSSYARELNNKPPLRDYTKYFQEKSGEKLDLKEVTKDAASDAAEDPAELEGPEDDEPYTDEEDENETLEYEDYQLNGEHKKAVEENREPYIIDASAFELECSNYEKVSLVYYISDDVLIEEHGAQADEVDRYDIVGTAFEDTHFDENNDEVMYVRNDILMCDYEITKVFTSFAEAYQSH